MRMQLKGMNVCSWRIPINHAVLTILVVIRQSIDVIYKVTKIIREDKRLCY